MFINCFELFFISAITFGTEPELSTIEQISQISL